MERARVARSSVSVDSSERGLGEAEHRSPSNDQRGHSRCVVAPVGGGLVKTIRCGRSLEQLALSGS
jgi:hypothetical protein